MTSPRRSTAMTDQPDPGAVRELRDLRADVPGRAPEDLHRARTRLLTEISAERETGASPRPAFPPRWLRPVLVGATAAAAVAALTVSLLPGPAAHRPRPGGGAASSQPST